MENTAYEPGTIMGALVFPPAFAVLGFWLIMSGYRQRK